MPDPPPKRFNSDEFGELFSKHRQSYVKLAYSFVQSINEAEDIVNDSFLYVLEHRDAISWDENIRHYLYKCVRNGCYSRLRERQRLYRAKDYISKDEFWRLESSLNALQNDELTNKMFSDEVSEIYYRELAKMPALTRSIYQASRNENLTYQEIAEKYELLPRRVASEMQLALSLFRGALKDYLHLFILVFAWMKDSI